MKFDKIQIKLASPEDILEWSHGEVTKPETINYRTLKPEKDGLYCERIFGPSKDWECHCGKYKKIKDKGIICDKCGVEVTKASVRRDRMGHIHLAAPVSHIWYFKGIPSRMDLILDIGPKNLEKVLYFAAYIVIDPGTTEIPFKKILTEQEYRELYDQYGNTFRVGMGAEAIYELLKNVDLESEVAKLKEELENTTSQKAARLIKRIEVMEAFLTAGTRPEWMILTEIPVIPPDLRPMVQLDGGRFATSDLNDLYRRIINRNNRLKRLLELGAPDIIVRNEKRMLQEAVDSLLDNSRKSSVVKTESNRPLKSLSDSLKGKQGRFRQNLLGKRVDYSARSVIVVGPELKMHECGLPKDMAAELYKPFIIRKLIERGIVKTVKSAKKIVDRKEPIVWDILEYVMKGHPVLLNRAPTLHRLGIQAFQPRMIEGKAIQLHPLACTAFNADFDGDQMAVHLPLGNEAVLEAQLLMLGAHNILNPANGAPITVPSQDMVLGLYYITKLRKGDKGEGLVLYGPEEAQIAYNEGKCTLHAIISVVVDDLDENGNLVKTMVKETSVGRLLFNQNVPEEMGYVNTLISKKSLRDIIGAVIKRCGVVRSAKFLDDIKNLGYYMAFKGGLSFNLGDVLIPAEKEEYVKEGYAQVEEVMNNYNMGFITNNERYNQIIDIWTHVNSRLTSTLMKQLTAANQGFNPIFMMLDSGARGSKDQIRQLAGMRGLMAKPQKSGAEGGQIIENPILANFKEGLSVLEYFISTHGARKGLADTALKTADAGYLTRRLVDVAHDVIITEEDCGTLRGLVCTELKNNEDVVATLSERILGRVSVHDVVDPLTGDIIVKSGEEINDAAAERIEKSPIESVEVRSVLTCESKKGVCAKCYGRNLATARMVQKGEVVGVIAAQSIGEPGTQLTMRTFHTGGVAGDDITQGLPRVEELFEARKPKKMATLAEIPGVVSIEETKKTSIYAVTVTNPVDGETVTYNLPYSAGILVANGDTVTKGQPLSNGAYSPHDVLRICGVDACRQYIIQEVQKVYRQQGVDINDKHIEIIVRQMMRKVRIDDSGSTNLLSGAIVDLHEFRAANRAIAERIAAGETELTPATAEHVLMGITKASLATESFLSAASFQETTKVLTDAAIKGKIDHLVGLKENVIIGKLIPAGSGLACYRNFETNEEPAVPAEPEDDGVDLSDLANISNAL